MGKREDIERRAIDDHCRAHKEHNERTGDTKTTGEQIERHVKGIAEQVEKEKGHKIYQR